MKSNLELSFLTQVMQDGLPVPRKEFRFYPKRRWRADFAWVEHKLLVEIEGGTLGHGRHTRPQGFENDCEKYNAATLLGWRVLRFTGAMVYNGTALETTRLALTKSLK